MPQSDGQTSMDERIQLILDELSLATRWQRPSLVTVTYRSEFTKKTVQANLVESLHKAGQTVLHYRVDREHYDIPLELKEHTQNAGVIYFVSNLSRGGGRGYSNAYRALNMHREYLVEAGIKAIFWMTEREGRQVARHAPDFWAFRHLVVAFPDLPATGKIKPGRDAHQPGDTLGEGEKLLALGCYEAALRCFRRVLRSHPEETSIHLRIAEVQIAMDQTRLARRNLRQATRSNERVDEFEKELSRLEYLLKSKQVPVGGITEG